MGVEVFFTSTLMSQSWKLIYDEHNFPFDVRYHLTDWFEGISWYDLKSDNKTDTTQVYQSLLAELDKKLAEPSLDQLNKLQLNTAKKRIQDEFYTRPAELVDVLKNCYSRERLLIASTKSDEDQESTEEDIELLKYREKETAFREIITELKQLSQPLELHIDEFHKFMPKTVAVIRDKQDRWNLLKSEADCDVSINRQKTNHELKTFHNEISQQCHVIQQCKSQLSSELTRGCQVLYRVLHNHCWALIAHYKQQQKLAICFLAKPPEGAVDALNKVCEESGRQLKAYIQYVERVLTDANLLVSRDASDKPLEIINKLRSELDVLLVQHLKETFVITKQPPNVQKIVQNKSPQLYMDVRMLGGRGLGIEHSLPCVTVRIYYESALKAALEAPGPTITGLCKSVENGNNVMMELKRATGHIQANLNNVQLREVERLEKRVREDRVTELKCGMVFYTQVNVCNKLYHLKALSLPIVLTSQTSQNGAATGTLIWDAAFSKQDRELYEDETSIPWHRMEEVLRAMFKETGRELDQDQINYIAHYIFKQGPLSLEEEDDFTHCILTKEKFLRDQAPGRQFSYWRWIYACKNLILNNLVMEWKNKMIHGFIGRKEAERLLRGCKPGTFLLRFRERRLEDSQRANKSACLAVAVVARDPMTRELKVDHVKDHLSPSNIHKCSLIRILSSLVDVVTKEPLLTTLYPDTDFEGLIKKYLPDAVETSAGYNETRLLIGVMNGKSEGPLSPLSSSENAGSMSPPSLPPTPQWMEGSPSPSTLPHGPTPYSPLSDDLLDLHVDPIITDDDDTTMELLTEGRSSLMMTPPDYRQ